MYHQRTLEGDRGRGGERGYKDKEGREDNYYYKEKNVYERDLGAIKAGLQT